MATATHSGPPTSPSTESQVPFWVLLIGGLILLAHLPLLIAHGQFMWIREHYQYYPIVPIGAIFLAAQRLQGLNLSTLKPGSPAFTYPILAISLLLLAVGIILDSSWLGAIAFLFLILAAIVGVGGSRLTRRLIAPWLFLWMAIPLPGNYDQTLIINLQYVTALWSSKVLDVLGVLHVMAGNVVQIPGQQLMVEQACSGIHSLYAALTCTFFYVIWAGRGFIHSVLLLVWSVGWVLVANVIRVIGVTILGAQWGLPVKEGIGHEAFGILVFLFLFGIILSTDRLLLFFTPTGWFRRRRRSNTDPNAEVSPAEREGGEELAPPTGIVGVPNFRNTWMSSWPVMGVYVLLCALQGWLMVGRQQFWPEPVRFALPDLGAQALPQEWNGWKQTDYKLEERPPTHIEGEFSQRWNYHFSHFDAAVSIDYPFLGWHELSNCYVGNGWKIDASEIEKAEVKEDGAETAEPFKEIFMTKSVDQHGYLLFAIFDRKGLALQPTTGGLMHRINLRLAAVSRIWEGLGAQVWESNELDRPSYQVQIFVQSYSKLTPAETKQVKAFFGQVLQSLVSDYSGFNEIVRKTDGAAPAPPVNNQQPAKESDPQEGTP